MKSNEVEDVLSFMSVVIANDGGAATVAAAADDDGDIILKDDVFVAALWDESFQVESGIVVVMVLMMSTVLVAFLVMLKLCIPLLRVVFSVLLNIEDW